MSLLWNKLLRVELSPTSLVLRQSKRGWRGAVEHETRLECAKDEAGAQWASPVTALRNWLGANRVGRRIEIVLSDHFLRYSLLPWSDQILGVEEAALYATLHFEALFGPGMEEWQVVSDLNEYGAAGLACAVEKALMGELFQICTEYSLRLVRVQPRFMETYNRWRESIAKDALIASIDAGRCLVVCRRGGVWHSIRALRMGSADGQEVAALIEREKLVQGLLPESVTYAHGSTKADLFQIESIVGATVLAQELA